MSDLETVALVYTRKENVPGALTLERVRVRTRQIKGDRMRRNLSPWHTSELAIDTERFKLCIQEKKGNVYIIILVGVHVFKGYVAVVVSSHFHVR